MQGRKQFAHPSLILSSLAFHSYLRLQLRLLQSITFLETGVLLPVMSAIAQEQAANPKSPLRRLSSLANLNFNPWNRRRSHLISDAVVLASSDTALTMPTLPSEVSDSYPSSTPFTPSGEVDGTMPTQPKPTFSNRRRSYITLSNESCHILPRSRTLSNLPVPVKAKGPTSAPKSRSTMMLPPSRIPTPKPDGRARLASATKSILKHSKGRVLQRSDTEPLLSENTTPKSPSGTPRTTAFKENLSLSPIKHSPRIDVFDDGFASASPPLVPLPKTQDDCSHGHRPPQTTPQTAFRTLRTDTVLNPQSSPIRETTLRRPSTPAKVHRYDSQSVLASISHNACRKRVSYSAGIKQHQLLTPRHPPTPPQPVAPLKTLSPTKTRRTRGDSNDLDMGSDMSPWSQRGTPTTLLIDPDKVREACCICHWPR
ncbi:hypothetical protein BDV97DRAFT_193866 [Delphinella strobiligena]|nr:hypothetical protein BDV97DRAFT_193866 [Delphinella strobiligena]